MSQHQPATIVPLTQAVSPDDISSIDQIYCADQRVGEYLIQGGARPDRLFLKFPARHESQGIEVFIKVIRPTHIPAGGKLEQPFQSLVSRCRSLQHPNLVPILDGGIFQGNYVVVEEAFSGFVLSRAMEGDHFTEEDKPRVIRGIAAGLAELHEEGLLHGDLNPSQVFITVSNSAKISGYVFSPMLEGIEIRPSRLSVRLRSFCAPEVLAGSSSAIGSDIFSLASICAYILAGHLDWEEHDGRLEALKLTLPVKAVLARAMDRDQAKRHQSVDELLVDLDRAWSQPAVVPARLPEPAKPAPAAATARPQPLRRILPLAAGALVLLALSIVVGILLSGDRTESTEVPAVAERDAGATRIDSRDPAPALAVSAAPGTAGSPVPANFQSDEQHPGWLILAQIPDGQVPWDRPAVIAFVDGADEGEALVAEITALIKSENLDESFRFILEGRASPVSMAERFDIRNRPAIVVADKTGAALASYSSRTKIEEIAFTLRMISKENGN